MKRLLSPAVFPLALLLVFGLTGALLAEKPAAKKAAAKKDKDAGFVSLFDGKTLKGWEGKEQFWSVKDGTITGETTADNPTKGNTFLIWRDGKVGDFELRCKFRIRNHNSGIQYRSKELGDFVVAGYQADIDGTGKFLGILYEEKGRGILAQRGTKVEITADGKKKVVGKTDDGDAVLKSFQNAKDGWNEYVIIAKGNHLVQKINGLTTIELVDHQTEKAAKSGILALQLHAGPPMQVQFKDIRLKRLD
jgi:hypothetical protein